MAYDGSIRFGAQTTSSGLQFRYFSTFEKARTHADKLLIEGGFKLKEKQ